MNDYSPEIIDKCPRCQAHLPPGKKRFCSKACYDAQRADDAQSNFASRFWAKVDKSDPDGCWPWTGLRDKDGYGVFYGGGRGKIHKAHRVAWELTNGPLLPGQSIRHVVCDNPPCCRSEPNGGGHLKPGSAADNNRDTWNRGRSSFQQEVPRGERHGRAKLTAQQVADIRAQIGSKSYKALAAEYGVSPATIYYVAKNITWSETV